MAHDEDRDALGCIFVGVVIVALVFAAGLWVGVHVF